jgi:hypothetical protein
VTTKGRRLVAAGQALGVALVCFATWLVLDAHRLYASALASPLGTRRSVAVAVLRPLARLSGTLDLDQPVHGADVLLGRGATPGGSAAAPPARRTSRPVALPGAAVVPRTARVHLRAHAGHATAPEGHEKLAAASAGRSATRVGSGTTPLAQPRPGHVLTILEVGDSIGEDLGIGLGNLLGSDPYVHVVQDAVGSTGLAAVGYYDWPAELELELRAIHPQLVVVMLGGNDAQSFDVGSTYVGFGSALWHEVYGGRVATMMQEATAAGAQVLWVGMPIMSPQSVLSNTDMQIENAVYAAEARRHHGTVYMSTWRLLATRAGQYAEYLPDASGNIVQVRDPDGVHVDAPGGTDLLASGVIAEIDRTWHVRL